MARTIAIGKHTISVHYINAFLQAAERLGLSRDEALQQAGLSPEMVANDKLRVTAEQLARVVKFVWTNANDELLGLTQHVTSFGMFDLFAEHTINCIDIREFYRYLCRFYNLVSKDAHINLNETDNTLRLELRLKLSDVAHDHSLYELLFLIWHRFPSWLAGRTIPLKRIEFTAEKQAHAGEFRLMYPCAVAFLQPVDCMIISAKALDFPIKKTACELQMYLKTIPASWFGQQIYSGRVTRRVEDLLRSAANSDAGNMENIAQQLNISTRTLRRKLLAEGSSFQKLVDAFRRDQAINLLNNQDVSMGKISERLGFSDPSAFSRAFKAWTGVTPGAYRNR